MNRVLVALIRGLPKTTEEIADLSSSYRPLLRETLRPPRQELLDTGVVAAIRDLGLDVDQRSMMLRPAWRCDAGALDQLSRRPAGLPDFGFLELRGPLLAAARNGCQSQAYQDAVARVQTDLSTALRTLDGAKPTQLWMVTTESPESVYRTFDLFSALRRALPWQRGMRVELFSGGALFHCKSGALRDRVRTIMNRLRFSECCELIDDPRAARDELLVRARPGVAFGDSLVLARPAFAARPDALVGCVGLPHVAHSNGPMTLADMAARLLAAAGCMHAERAAQTATAAPQPSTAAPSGSIPADSEDLVSR